jgi:hypothetical protein
MSKMEPMMLAYIAFAMLLLIAMTLYLFPRFLVQKTPMETEGFTTIALNTTDFPKCVARDADAQQLLAALHAAAKTQDTLGDYDEFRLIVQKLLCMDADITSLGQGEYASLQLPFATLHDMEPVGVFVGRCLKNAVKQRDLDLIFDKYRTRGMTLLNNLCANGNNKAWAITMFDGIVNRTQKNITAVCLKERASMDVPAGVRDPAYYTPSDVAELGPYQNTAPKYNFN